MIIAATEMKITPFPLHFEFGDRSLVLTLLMWNMKWQHLLRREVG